MSNDKHYHLGKRIFIFLLFIVMIERRIYMTDKEKKDQWDAKSRNESDQNFVLGEHYGNPWNNTNNPNWLNSMVNNPYRKSMLNDPQRVEKKNLVEDNNGNKKVYR